MKEKESPQYCVVTGASQGLGSAFANELARRNYNLILVSLPEQGLPELSARIRQMHAVDCIYYETDFSEDRNILMLAEWINERFAVHMLINNAGLGGTPAV